MLTATPLTGHNSLPAMDDQERLCRMARDVARKAYAPYSRFRVGAALLCEDGSIVTGANVENRSYGLTICAERSAISAAVSTGKRRFVALAVAGIDAHYPLPPCGACRQVISEFLPADAAVYFCCAGSPAVTSTVGELIPFDSLTELADSAPHVPERP